MAKDYPRFSVSIFNFLGLKMTDDVRKEVCVFSRKTILFYHVFLQVPEHG